MMKFDPSELRTVVCLSAHIGDRGVRVSFPCVFSRNLNFICACIVLLDIYLQTNLNRTERASFVFKVNSTDAFYSKCLDFYFF